MALGLGGGGGNGEGGAFLPLLKYDARSGRMNVSQRSQNAITGAWESEDQDISRLAKGETPSFVVDFGSIEVGWIEFSKPPAFAVVPLGKAMPAKPGEGFKQGFRVKVAGKLLATPEGAMVREFASTSNAVKGAMDTLHTAFEAAPEAAAGKVPVVAFVDTRAIKTQTPQGTTTNYAPVFEIVQWVDRHAMLGERTVPPPIAGAKPAPAPAAAPAPAPKVKEMEDSIPF